jgi:DNA-binding beta-propeller fold protein YncE
LPDGTFFVSDGYGNTRVAKFDKNGKFLMMWGTRGTGNGQLQTPHSIAIDKSRRVYVADRANNRIQVFDENGKYLDQFPNIQQPYHIRISDDQALWVFSGPLDKFLKYDLNGHLVYAWGTNSGRRLDSSGRSTNSQPTRTAICTRRKCSAGARRSSSRARVPIRLISTSRSR